MDGDEEVGLVAVGDVGALFKGNEYVGLAGVDHLDVATVGLDEFAEGECHIEVDVLLLGICADGTGVVAAVAGIDNQLKLVGARGGKTCRRGASRDKERCDYLSEDHLLTGFCLLLGYKSRQKSAKQADVSAKCGVCSPANRENSAVRVLVELRHAHIALGEE